MTKRKTSFLEKKSKFPTSFTSFLLLVFISSFLFVSPQLSNKKVKESNRNIQHTHFSYSDTYLQHFHKLPFIPNPSEQESSDENEVSEESNDSINSFGLITQFSFVQIIKDKDLYLHQLIQTLQNCDTVALFILHHSWKNFF